MTQILSISSSIMIQQISIHKQEELFRNTAFPPFPIFTEAALPRKNGDTARTNSLNEAYSNERKSSQCHFNKELKKKKLTWLTRL